MAIIQSLLDTDLYKFSMMQGAWHQFPKMTVSYAFACRNVGVDLRPIAADLCKEISAFCRLRFKQDELTYLARLDYLTDDFIELLRTFQLKEEQVHVRTDSDQLQIEIEGPWVETILFEVPLLAMVNELFFRMKHPRPDFTEGRARLQAKIDQIDKAPYNDRFIFSDFGTRRRFSRPWQREVVTTLKEAVPQQLTGTSNVLLARELGLTPIGTMAHEWLMAGQVLAKDLADSQKIMLKAWVREYQGRLGIALTDIVGQDAFLADFDRTLANRFDGVRQDSGDPAGWAEKMIRHYRKLGIDPMSKTLVFSDGLTVTSALSLHQQFQARAKLAFGIGTHLTNDLGYYPLQIVIKPVAFDGQPVAKISDSPGKCMCEDRQWIKQLATTFQVDLAKVA